MTTNDSTCRTVGFRASRDGKRICVYVGPHSRMRYGHCPECTSAHLHWHNRAASVAGREPLRVACAKCGAIFDPDEMLVHSDDNKRR